MTRKRTDAFGNPLVYLLEDTAVVTVFHYWGGRWRELGRQSKAEFRRLEELRRLPREERDRQATGRGGWTSHRVKLIGDEPFAEAYRSAWNGLRTEEIPGYREVYDFGRGRVYRAERLYPALDAVRDAGGVAVQLDTLNKIMHRLRPSGPSC
jgi:hypothetical protein